MYTSCTGVSCGVEEANDRYERVIASSASCVGRLMRETVGMSNAGGRESLGGSSTSAFVSENESVRVADSAATTTTTTRTTTTTTATVEGSETEYVISYAGVFNEKVFWRGLVCDSERPTVRKAAYELISEVGMVGDEREIYICQHRYYDTLTSLSVHCRYTLTPKPLTPNPYLYPLIYPF